MDLLEYQGKQLFAKHGVPVPDGRPATTVQEAVEAAEELGYPVVIKAQVQIGGRGKAGGVKGGGGRPVAETDPEAMRMLHVDPLLGLQDFHGRRLAFESGIAEDMVRPVGAMLAKLYDVFVREDATLVEVNPLLITKAREVVALDAKVTVDDNALYRHPDVAGLRDASAEDPQERMAKERGLTYVKLDGNVGILGNGAGLVMSTLDVVAQAGGKPANFLDAGGGSKAEAITSAVEVILSNPNVKAVLFNIFGGITRCDEVASGILQALDQIDVSVPIVVRLDGTNDDEGRRILAEADLPNVHTEATMLGAAKKVVELAGAQG